MRFRMIAGVILACIALHLQVVRCGKNKNDPKNFPMVYKRSRFVQRRKGEMKSKLHENAENIKENNYPASLERRSEYTKGESTEPINKIIDKLKWFVEHKGRRNSKESGYPEKSVEGVGTRQVDSFSDKSPEVRETKYTASFRDDNEGGGKNKLVDFSDDNPEGSKAEGSKTSNGVSNEGAENNNNNTVTHYIEADFGKEPSTLSGFLNNHKVKKLKMVLPGGHEFNLLNDEHKKGYHGSSKTHSSSDESESSGQGKSDDQNAGVDFKVGSENKGEEQNLQFSESSDKGDKDTSDATSSDIKENNEEIKHEGKGKEKGESSSSSDDVANVETKEKLRAHQHSDDGRSFEMKEKESSQYKEEERSSSMKEKGEGSQRSDEAASLDVKDKSGVGQQADEGGSLSNKERGEGREHADEASSLEMKEKSESNSHSDESASVESKEKGASKQHNDEDASSVAKEKGEGMAHSSQFPPSSSKGADDLDIADMKSSNDITLKNLGAIEYDGEVKMDGEDNKGDSKMQMHSTSKERDSEHEIMSHERKSEKEGSVDRFTHDIQHNKDEGEHEKNEHTLQHDEGHTRHELGHEGGEDQTKHMHGESKEDENGMTSKSLEKEVSPETNEKEASIEGQGGRESSSALKERKQSSFQRERRKEDREKEGKEEVPSEREGKKEASNEKEERKESSYEKEDRNAEKEERKENTSEEKGGKEAALEKQGGKKGAYFEKDEKEENLEGNVHEKDVPSGEINGKEVLHKVQDDLSHEMTKERSKDYADHHEEKSERSKEKVHSSKEEASKFRNKEEGQYKEKERKHAEAYHKAEHRVEEEPSIGKITADAPEAVDHTHYMPHESSASGNFERPSYSDKMTPSTTTNQPQTQSHSYQDNLQRGGFVGADDKNHRQEKTKGIEMFGLGHGCGDAAAGDSHGCQDPGHQVQTYHHHAEVPESQGFHQESVAPAWYQHDALQGSHQIPLPGDHQPALPGGYSNHVSFTTPCDHAHSDCHHESYSFPVHETPCDNLHSDCHTPCDCCCHTPCDTCHTPCDTCHTPCDTCHTPCDTCHTPCDTCHTPCDTCHTPCDCCCHPPMCKVTKVTKCKHKPDIIKVEFVPEEVSITVGNKTKAKPLNPSGKIKVQFLPGEPIIESSKPALEDAVARSNNGAVSERRKVVVSEENVQSVRNEPEPSNENVVGTVVLDNGRLSGLHNTGSSSSSGSPEFDLASYHTGTEKTKKTHHISVNGYESHPSLPFLPKPVYNQHAETREKEGPKTGGPNMSNVMPNMGNVIPNMGNIAQEHTASVEIERTATYSNDMERKRGEDDRPKTEGEGGVRMRAPITENSGDILMRGGENGMERPNNEMGVETPVHNTLDEKHARMETTMPHGIETNEGKSRDLMSSSFSQVNKMENETPFYHSSSGITSGYEKKPSLPPFLDKKDLPSSLEGHHLETEMTGEKENGKTSAESEKMGLHSRGGGGGGGGGEGGGAHGAPGVPSLDSNERIDPELTSLGQQYPQAVGSEVKTALVQERSTPVGAAAEAAPSAQADPDRVFMGGMGGTIRPPDPSFTGGPVASPDPSPDPNPTIRPPSDPGSPGSSSNVNLVAAHISDAINNKAVSQEEALQMMNDFVSGNQDMTKAAKNVDSMIAQITTQRGHDPSVPDAASSSMGSSSALSLPGETIRSPDEVKFFNAGDTPGGSSVKLDDSTFINTGGGGGSNKMGLNSGVGMGLKNAQMFNPGAGMESKNPQQMFNRGVGMDGKNPQMQSAQMFNSGGSMEGKNAQMFNPVAALEGKNSMFNPGASLDAKIAQISNSDMNIGDKASQMFNPAAGMQAAGIMDKSSAPPFTSPSGSFVNKGEPQMGAARSNRCNGVACAGGGSVGQQNAFLNQNPKYGQGNEFNPMQTSQSFMNDNVPARFANSQQHMPEHAESPLGEFSQRGEYITQDMATGTMRRVGQQPDVVESFRSPDYENSRSKSSQGNIADNFRTVPQDLENPFNSNFQKQISLSSPQHAVSYMGTKSAPGAMENVRGGLGPTEIMSNMMPGNSGGRTQMREMGSSNTVASSGHMMRETPSVRGNSGSSSNGEPASLMGMMASNNMQKQQNPIRFYGGGDPSSRPNTLGRTMQSIIGNRFSESEAETPQGHIMPVPQDDTSKAIGLPENTDMPSGFSRKFQTPHAADQSHNALKKLQSKPVSGARKDNVIADMYADTIFPEDINDIDSLQGSLAGKTLTNYDMNKV